MNRTILLFALTSMLLATVCRAQTTVGNEIGASFGGTLIGLRDRHASAMIYDGLSIAPKIEYVHNGEHDRHIFDASYFSDEMSTTIDNFRTVTRGGRIRYSYVHEVTDFRVWDNPLKLFLGGAVGSFLSHSDFMYLYTPLSLFGQGNESWYWSNSLDVVALMEYQPAEHQGIRAALWFPVLSSISRPTYSPSGNYNYVEQDWKFSPPWPWKSGSLESFPDNVAFDISVSYTRPLIWDFDFQVSYEFSYAGLKGPQETRMYQNTLRVGMVLCF